MRILDHSECHLNRKYPINKTSQISRTKERKYTKQDLLSLLKYKVGYKIPPGTYMNIGKSKCAEHSIFLKSPPELIIQEGWYREANGIMHQILWKRGFISKRDKAKYTVDAKKDEFGFRQNNISLR